jgi:type IV secretion system protein VirB9
MSARLLTVWLALAALSLASLPAEANGRRAAAERDPRIRYVAYHQDRVVAIPTALGVSTMIQFAADEVVETVSAGDTKGWSIVPRKGSGIIFVKPLEEGAETNVNVVTNRRVYAIVLRTATTGATRSAFHVRFRYPGDEATARLRLQAERNVRHPALAAVDPARVNWDFAFRGDETLRPRLAFDDGVKTFLAFTGEIPAVFIVGEGGRESLVNFRREGDLIVIDKVHAQMTLRAGGRALCLYNRRFRSASPDPLQQAFGPRPLIAAGDPVTREGER